MSLHGPGRIGEGPNVCPRRFLLGVWGGGGSRNFVVKGGELGPKAKPSGLHSLRKLRRRPLTTNR